MADDNFANSTSDSAAQDEPVDRKRSREIFQWLQHVARDAELPDGAVRLATVLADMTNRDTYREHGIHETFPEQKWLRATLCRSKSSVIRNIEALRARGHLDVIGPEQIFEQNTYRLIISPGVANETREDDRVSQTRPDRVSKTKPPGCHKRDPSRVSQTRPKYKHKKESNHLNQPSERNHQTQTRAPELFEVIVIDQAGTHIAHQNHTAAFEEFLQVYPPNESFPDAAKAAFSDAVASGVTPGELIAAARRYAAARVGEETRYTKFPENWLRERRWLANPSPASGPMSMLDALREWSAQQ